MAAPALSRSSLGRVGAGAVGIAEPHGATIHKPLRCSAQSAQAIRTSVAIQAEQHFFQRNRRGRQSAQAGLNSRHEQRRGNAFAGHVGHDQQQAATVAVEYIIVIAGYGVCRWPLCKSAFPQPCDPGATAQPVLEPPTSLKAARLVRPPLESYPGFEIVERVRFTKWALEIIVTAYTALPKGHHRTTVIGIRRT